MKYREAMKKEVTLRKIFQYLMENGYCPTFEKTYITFGVGENIAVLEYEENILSVRLFFSIEEEQYEDFLEASNSSMINSFLVRTTILDDRKNIMFSCETLCDTFRDFQRFFPRLLELLAEGLDQHKNEMKELLIMKALFLRRKGLVQQQTTKHS